VRKSCNNEKELKQIYQSAYLTHSKNRIQKLARISKYFLVRPYKLNNLGDGPDSYFDQYPIYRLDVFDCETYVETMLAIALSENEKQFKQNIVRIRYQTSKPSFLNRNHFPELDWNIHNAEKGYIKDITKTIVNSSGVPIFKMASSFIDRPSWFRRFTLNDFRLRATVSHVELEKRFSHLQQEAQYLRAEYSSIAFLPLEQISTYVLKQIPNACIIEIVRENWQIKDKTGTDLNVSHMGFAFWKNDKLYFREASSVYHQTVDVLLTDYLEQKVTKNPSVVGINLQQIRT
jgi:hypothetical protein